MTEGPTVGRSVAAGMPERIGPYRILEELGSGGMGVVYLADQEHPVRRRVAVKVIKLGLDTKEVIARFESERQALAMMSHPNIARVLEAGTTAEGRPYFVMEHVPGVPITDYCDRHRLSMKERLDLFVPVCQAIHHAHQKAIIHRDIKPSNVLVMLLDGVPVPKVIDFGVAKALDRKLTEKTVFTEQGRLIGTPAYMSPEQAEMTGLNIDTTTDVYSLGVLLYELLVGELPFDTKALLEGGWDALHRVIREVDPPKPSTRVSSLGEKAGAVALQRRMEPAQLEHQLRRELDWITMRAMEKDRTRRYESAAALAQDIARYLNDEPVLAGPPSTAYRVGKFVKRHRAALLVSAVVLASLVFATVESTRQRLVAERALEESEAVTAFLSNMLSAVDPAKRGREVTVREILDEAATNIDRQFGGKPLVRSRLMAAMGGAYLQLGHFDEARPLLQEALSIRGERALAENELLVAETLHLLGNLDLETADYASSKRCLEAALAIREKRLGPEHPEFARTLNDLGLLQRTTGDRAEARALFERALAVREKTLGPDHPDVAKTLNDLAGLLYMMRDYAGARPLYERASAIQEKALGPEHTHLAATLSNYATLLGDTGDLETARAVHERALAIERKALGEEHPDVANSLTSLAILRQKAEDFAGAKVLYEQALAITEKAFGPEHPDVSMNLNNLAACLMDLGDNDGARPLFERALSIREKSFGPEHFAVAQSLNNLAYLNAVTGDYAAAVPLLERAMAVEEKVLGPEDVHVADTASRLAEVLRLLGDEAAAARYEARAKRVAAQAAQTAPASPQNGG
ncbi:MAG: tetratricopeptide repeat protein [Candidatus Eiseniibacteriota bacterium]